jgi:MFS family permease
MSDASAGYPGYGSKSYRAYVLGALLVVYTFNFIDRILIGIVQEPIRAEFGVSNFMLGILGGPAFAVLYTLLGIPIARYAERGNRIGIVTIGLTIWSAMTTLCGFAGNYLHLLLARIGVGIGEAACTPPAHSALSDYFPASRRATALAIYTLGVPIGTMFAAIGGGWMTQHFDWRAAFMILGAPGLVLALIVKVTVREPPRVAAATAAPSFSATFASLARKPSFWHIAFGAALVSLVGYGSAQFLVSHFVRNYDLGATIPIEIAHGSYAFGIIGGVAVGIGTFMGGFLSDRLAARHKRVLTWLPTLGVALAIPLYLLSFAQTDFAPAFALLLLAPIFHYLYLGPTFAVAQSVAEPRMRATATAIMLLVINLIGYGLGPPFVGAMADVFAAGQLSNAGLAAADCAAPANAAACFSAGAIGLKFSLATTLIFMAWAGLHFTLAGRTLERDRVS